MVDSLEKLGIDRHFKEEIESILEETWRMWQKEEDDIFLEPTTCAMAFRLLRLHGYNVSSGTFCYAFSSSCLFGFHFKPKIYRALRRPSKENFEIFILFYESPQQRIPQIGSRQLQSLSTIIS
ncbi:ent-kaur-16-ene synthase, chloroplastic-like [Neltuma alba]|uniref:ent-kaur-16-ene synthase, chloroplastic-like n=1 Tax=Neltuma alba TaxID=207710 RepID=UPI0010A3E033|nr:ent-kaur-16-ene synthase, chloroplastic-like [Prosopis alba]